MCKYEVVRRNLFLKQAWKVCSFGRRWIASVLSRTGAQELKEKPAELLGLAAHVADL